MNASSPIRVMNKVVNLRPMVSFASRMVGSGPSRLKMVRFWHELDRESFQSEPGRSTLSD